MQEYQKFWEQLKQNWDTVQEEGILLFTWSMVKNLPTVGLPNCLMYFD